MEMPHFDGCFTWDEAERERAAKDYGNRHHHMPLGVLHPKSVDDVSRAVRYVFEMGSASGLTVAARGRGHSQAGQCQAGGGVVICMESLARSMGMEVFQEEGREAYVEVSGGELWINVLHESLKWGLTPKSWTDYLHLTVGGTLSYAGFSGQAFKHGPQIDNVYQLQVVTGEGEIVNCSEEKNSDLFEAVLGGLGQFGIITRARISLEPAPTMVKWIRVVYSDFSAFVSDQVRLISSENCFDYMEGSVSINRTDLSKSCHSSFTPRDPVGANQFVYDEKILFCLELAKYLRPQDSPRADQEFENVISGLSYVRPTLFETKVSYVDFLDRVHHSEIKLREKGLWDVPRAWLNLIMPKSSIHEFAEEIFGKIVKDSNNGLVLLYPINKSRWKIANKSLVTPEGDVLYLLSFLFSSTERDSIDDILAQNNKIIDCCERSNLRVKQYMPSYSSTEEWKTHFGPRWEVFRRRKLEYDPRAILAPGQRIFPRCQ